MLVNLTDIFINEGSSKTIDCTFSMKDVSIGGIQPLDLITTNAIAKNTAGLITLSICTEFDYIAPCDRCGKKTQKHFSYHFEHIITASIVGDVDDEYIEAPDYVIDLQQTVFDDIILALPLKFLCNENCKGLCQICGKNLNDGDCGCNKKQIDPRLEVLKDLLK